MKFKKRIGFLLCLVFLGINMSFANPIKQDTIDYFNIAFEDLMNLEITAVSKKAESTFDAPLSSSIITKEEIVNSGATCIEELFKLVPGFIVREESNGNYDIHIRGNDNLPSGNFTFFSENSMTLIMVDGRKVFNNMNGGTFWEAIPVSLTDIERVEVIRGASTALYGPNAVSGVINIITKTSPDKHMSVDGNFMYGSAQSMVSDFAVNTSSANNKLKARISANYEQRDRFDNNYYSWTNGTYVPYPELADYITGKISGEGNKIFSNPNLAKKKHALNTFINYNASEDINLGLSAGVQNSSAQTVYMESSYTPLSTRESNTYYFNSINQIHGLNIQLSGNYGTQNILRGSWAVSKYDIHNLDATVEYDWTIGNLTLRPGASYQHVVYDDTPYIDINNKGNAFLNGSATLNTFAYYLRGDYNINEKLRLIAALRMDHLTMHILHTSSLAHTNSMTTTCSVPHYQEPTGDL